MEKVRIRANGQFYLIDSSSVLEIVPVVELLPASEKTLAGKMRYRGEIIPVIDLCFLLTGRAHQTRFSTRILIIERQERKAGLIAEGVTDLVQDGALAKTIDLDVILTGYL